MDAYEIEVVQARLAPMKNRLKEIDKLLPTVGPDYQRQELASERTTLAGLIRKTERRLNPPDPAIKEAHRAQLRAQAERMRQRHQRSNVTAEDKAARAARRAQLIDTLEAKEKANMERTAQRFEREGDHRNARLWREFTWQIRQRLEAQIP